MFQRPIALLFACSTLIAQEGGIEVFAGETLFGEGTRWSITEIYKKADHFHRGSDEVRAALDQEWTEFRTVLGYDYGLRPDLTVTALLPFVYREWRQEGMPTQEADGLGDLALLGKYKIYQNDWKGGATNVSLITGLEFPTGATDATTMGLRNAPKAQTGSGAYNPIVAAALTVGDGRMRYDGLVFYKFNTEGAQAFEVGDFLVASVTTGYRFYNAEYPGATVAARVGLQYRHNGRSEMRGVGLTDSGSDELWLQLAIAAHPKPDIDLSLSLDLPIYEYYNGQQLARDLQVSLKFGIRF